ncbi:MAG: hypothetical protein PHX83_14355 [Acidobacteriia bacterium]|nr:hypothetical protein [Terriglobia bacterium]
MKLPRFLKPFSPAGKAAVRGAVRFRLDHFPLSMKQAEQWVKTFKKWPGIFSAGAYTRQVEVAPGILMNLGLIDVVERTLLIEHHWETPVIISELSEEYLGGVGQNVREMLRFMENFGYHCFSPQG